MSRFCFLVIYCCAILHVLIVSATGNAGSACQDDDDCRKEAHYVCLSGVCTCKPGYFQELVNTTSKCVFVGIPVGERCLSDESCINQNRTFCSGKHICVCRHGFYENSGICKRGRKLGDACRGDEQCEATNNGSHCRGSACRCKEGFYQESVGGNATCSLGSPPLQLCYTNYDCFIRDRHLVCDGRFCRCRQGYHMELTSWGWRCIDSTGLQRPSHGSVVSMFRISPAAILIACVILGYMKRRQKPDAGQAVDRHSGSRSHHFMNAFVSRPHHFMNPFHRRASLREVVTQRCQGGSAGDSFDQLLPPNTCVNLPPEPPPYQAGEEPPPSYEEAIRSSTAPVPASRNAQPRQA
ncbi:uncharacterized protein LOC135396918 [Ornithodoros turicata]|uniref:Putative secreted protein n=1 Tax=Ornithodoros turicata TaxID=34597 RepID=A0A2R5LN62_9ACAR